MNAGYAVYEVTGRRRYRGHPPGTRFEARLDPLAEQRALDRGDIQVIERVEPELEPGSYALPNDWPPQRPMTQANEAPEGASSM